MKSYSRNVSSASRKVNKTKDCHIKLHVQLSQRSLYDTDKPLLTLWERFR